MRGGPDSRTQEDRQEDTGGPSEQTGEQMDYINSRIQNHKRKGIMVGITTRCSEENLRWLKDFLTKEFQDRIQDVEYLPITNSNRYKWEDKIKEYSAVILYHSKHQGRVNITDVEGGIYNEELNYLCHTLGREKVLVVLDDMEDTSMEERQRVLDTQPGLTRLSSQLILIPETEKHGAASRKRAEFLPILGAEQSRATTSHAEENLLHQKCPRTRLDDDNICGNGSPTCLVKKRAAKKKKPNLYEEDPHRSPSKYKVCIFSRSADENYRWLLCSLQTAKMKRSIDVRSVYISNNGKTFYSEMSQCSLAILYHTKKQGRLNITDVTDSLYDQELRDLSECLGRKHVIVVVDDLVDTSDAEKMRIREHQPSIGSLAKDLFLFSEKHKDPEKMQQILTLIEEGVAVHVKTRPLSPWYIGAQGEDEPPGVNSETTSPTVDINTSHKHFKCALLGDDHKSLIQDEDDLSHLRETTPIKPPGANSETTPLDMDINASPSHSIPSVCSDDHESSSIQDVDDLCHLRETTPIKPPRANSETTPPNRDINASAKHYNYRLLGDDPGSSSVWYDDDMCHLERATLYKATGSNYETTSSSLDIYTSRKRHNFSLHGRDHKSSSSKKTSFDCPPTDNWMDSQLTELNDSCSVFCAKLSEFNNTWRLFQQVKQNPQTAIQKLLSKIQTQEAELAEKDIMISNLRKEKEEEVLSFKSEIQDKQRTIEEKDKLIQELKECREQPAEKMQEGDRDILQHSAGKPEEIIQEKEKVIMQLRDEIQNIWEKFQNREKSEGLQKPLRKRREAKKWPSKNMEEEQDGDLDAPQSTEPETMENHSNLEDVEPLGDNTCSYRHKMTRLWSRITELGSRVKQLEYTTDYQKHELDKYRQTVKEQSSQINNYAEILDSLLNKTEEFRKMHWQ